MDNVPSVTNGIFSEKLTVTYAFQQRVLSRIRKYKLRQEIYQVSQGGVC